MVFLMFVENTPQLFRHPLIFYVGK